MPGIAVTSTDAPVLFVVDYPNHNRVSSTTAWFDGGGGSWSNSYGDLVSGDRGHGTKTTYIATPTDSFASKSTL